MFDYITYVSFKIIFNGQAASASCTTVSHPPAGVIARSHTYVTNLWQELRPVSILPKMYDHMVMEWGWGEDVII